jgi:FixJ family two-component response regulator
MSGKVREALTGDRQPVVHIADGDESVRRVLGRLMDSLNMRAELFASAEEFLRYNRSTAVACLLLDIQLPQMGGFELYELLRAAGYRVPVIFITAHPDDDAHARAAELDAVALLEKPFDEVGLFYALESAFDRIMQPPVER